MSVDESSKKKRRKKPKDAGPDASSPDASSPDASSPESSEEGAAGGDEPQPQDGPPAASSWGFPAFARDFPRDPELDDLVAAFARGDYAAIRLRAPKLAASTTDDDVKRAAVLLRERIEPDPTSRYMFLFAAALLAFLTIWWVAHDGPPDKQPQSSPATPAKSATPVPTVEHID